MTFVAGFLGLTSGAKLADVQDAILNLRNQNKDLAAENKTLKDKVAAFELQEKAVQTAEATSLLDAAATDGRITVESRPMWAQNFADNHDNSKRLLALMQGKVAKLSDFAQSNANGGKATDAILKYQGKTFSELSKESPKVLANLKDQDPATFNHLYKAEFGKDWMVTPTAKAIA